MSKKTYTREEAKAVFIRRNAAQEALRVALLELQNADKEWVLYELNAAPDAQTRAMEFLAQNQSTWSGGLLSTNNIQETSVREAAASFVRFGLEHFA